MAKYSIPKTTGENFREDLNRILNELSSEINLLRKSISSNNNTGTFSNEVIIPGLSTKDKFFRGDGTWSNTLTSSNGTILVADDTGLGIGGSSDGVATSFRLVSVKGGTSASGFKATSGTVISYAGYAVAGDRVQSGSQSNHPYVFVSNNSERARFEAAGTFVISVATQLNGGTTIGDAAGDSFTINSSAVSIPNGLNFDSNTFVIDAATNCVGIGTASPTAGFVFDVRGHVRVATTNPELRWVGATDSWSWQLVDSDNRMRLFDQTSGAEWLTVWTDGRLSGTALHNNSGSVTGTTNQYIASGTYTPTLTGVTNVASSTAYACQWMRVGNVVTVSGRVDVDPTAAGGTNLGVSLPIASNFTALNECGGAGNDLSNLAEVAGIYGDATNNRAELNFLAVSTASRAITFSFTYVII